MHCDPHGTLAPQAALQVELEGLMASLAAQLHVISMEDAEVSAVLGDPRHTSEAVQCRPADVDLHRLLLACAHAAAAELGTSLACPCMASFRKGKG